MSLLDAINRIIKCEIIHLPIHSQHYLSPQAKKFLSEDIYLKCVDNEMMFAFIKNHKGFMSYEPLEEAENRRFYESENDEWFFDQMPPMSCFYNKQMGLFRWMTGSEYLLSIQQVTTDTGFEVIIYIDNEDQFKDPSSVFVPTILRALLKE